MKKASKHCKLNCLNKYLMLKAELKIMKCDLSGGLELFEKSALISKKEGFIHERAIAYERAGLAVLYLSKYILALPMKSHVRKSRADITPKQ